MDFIQTINDSVLTSVSMKFFSTKEKALIAHIYNSKLIEFPIEKCKNYKLNNFNSERLQSSAVKAYPLDNRPRGINDISSIKFYQKEIKKNNDIQPIWLLKKGKEYTLLDGAHRIVASYIEHEKYIPAYVIDL